MLSLLLHTAGDITIVEREHIPALSRLFIQFHKSDIHKFQNAFTI